MRRRGVHDRAADRTGFAVAQIRREDPRLFIEVGTVRCVIFGFRSRGKLRALAICLLRIYERGFAARRVSDRLIKRIQLSLLQKQALKLGIDTRLFLSRAI